MKTVKAIALPCPKAQEFKLAVRAVDDQDLYVNFVNRHPGHLRRISDRRIADRLGLPYTPEPSAP